MAIKSRSRTFTVEPSYTELVNPALFLKMCKSSRENIEFVRIVPPRLGSKTVGGRILVRRKKPIYRMPFRSPIK